MKHFVSVVFNQKNINEKQIVESMLSSANMALMESHTVYGLFESDNDNLVLKLRLDRELTESESDKFAERLANKLFDQGYDDFDIEVSVEGVEIYEQATSLNLNDYRRQIEAAGPYVVSADGMNVTMRDGSGSVAGVNQNGQLWSGSQVITDIVRRGQTDSRQPTGPGTTTSAPRGSREPSGSLSAFAQSGEGGIANNPEETEAIRELQDRLRDAGFDPGASDGRYGPRTANAVRQFQQANNLSVDGDAGPETIQALLGAEQPAAEPEQPAAEPEQPADEPETPVQGAPEPRSSASIAADPDNTGNAADPEAQTFVQDTPAATRQIRIATRGPGTDEDSIFRVMSSIQSPEQWEQLQQEFEAEYGMNLIDHLSSELNAADMTRYVWDPLGRIGVTRDTGAGTGEPETGEPEQPAAEPVTPNDQDLTAFRNALGNLSSNINPETVQSVQDEIAQLGTLSAQGINAISSELTNTYSVDELVSGIQEARSDDEQIQGAFDLLQIYRNLGIDVPTLEFDSEPMLLRDNFNVGEEVIIGGRTATVAEVGGEKYFDFGDEGEPGASDEPITGSDNGMDWTVTPSDDQITIDVNETRFTVDRSQTADGAIEMSTTIDGEVQTVDVVESEFPELYAELSRLLTRRNESRIYSNPILEAFELEEETYDGNDFYEAYGDLWFNEDEDLDEAEYQGRKVKLGKPMRGDVKKFKVYVRKPNGKVVKVNFGDPDMKIKKSNPARRRSFRARHNCDNPGPRWKARYWSCRKW